MSALTVSHAVRIRELHEQARALAQSAIERALEAGRLLAEVKTELQHGDFGAWVEEHCGFTARTAQRYMRLHEHREQLPAGAGVMAALSAFKSDTVSHLDAALALEHQAEQLKSELRKLDSALHGAGTLEAALQIATRAEELQGAAVEIRARAARGLALLEAGRAAS